MFGGVVKISDLLAKGDARGIVMFDVGGGIVRASVVLIEVWFC